jgi:hypothetical protein
MRCSSIDSAIAPYLRVPRASWELSNYPPRREVYPIVLSLFPAVFRTRRGGYPPVFTPAPRGNHSITAPIGYEQMFANIE